MLLIVRLAVPVLVSVTVWGGLLVPRSWVPNVRLVGENVTAGVPAKALTLHSGINIKATHNPPWAREQTSHRTTPRRTRDHSPLVDCKTCSLQIVVWGRLGGERRNEIVSRNSRLVDEYPQSSILFRLCRFLQCGMAGRWLALGLFYAL